MQDYGKLICDLSKSKQFKKAKTELTLKNFLWGILMFIGGLLGLVLAILGYIKFPEARPYDIVIMSFIVILSVFSIIIPAIRIKLALTGFQIYENGITLPWRTKKQRKEDKENFILFAEIDEIYFNPKDNLEYVTIRGKNIGNLDVNKEFIPSLFEFKRLIEQKVNVNTDKNYHISRKERWFNRIKRN